ncbi:MAG TPA: glycosyltransferase family 2 protein [Gemmatimonadaceae bacterium]|jgi:N-acetylglucosaminyl-diphospho-decaprenol L-rhamnosyltransferase
MTAQSRGPRTAIVTVSFGSEGVLDAFLASAAGSTIDPVFVVVADNRPDAGHARKIAEQHSAEYLPMTENLGYGGAMNVAVAALPDTVEWVLISNPDVVLGPGALDAMVAVGDEDDSIGSIGPAVRTMDGEIYPSARAIPSIRTGVGHALFANLWHSNPWTKSYLTESDAAGTRRDAGWLSGSCVLVRRSAFTRLAGFDTGYFMYFEDVDLGFRLGKAGYRNVYEPSISVTHIGAHATESESAAMIAAHHDSAKRFLARKYPGVILWPVRAILNVGLNVRSALAQRRS